MFDGAAGTCTRSLTACKAGVLLLELRPRMYIYFSVDSEGVEPSVFSMPKRNVSATPRAQALGRRIELLRSHEEHPVSSRGRYRSGHPSKPDTPPTLSKVSGKFSRRRTMRQPGIEPGFPDWHSGVLTVGPLPRVVARGMGFEPTHSTWNTGLAARAVTVPAILATR